MTNEVLQKTASDEQNVSSSNGLEPKLRFPNFIEKWTRFEAENIFKNITDKNHPTDTVLTIQQGRGTLPRDLSGRNILYDNTNTKNYKRVQFGDFIIHLRSFEGGLEMANEQGIVSPAARARRARTCPRSTAWPSPATALWRLARATGC